MFTKRHAQDILNPLFQISVDIIENLTLSQLYNIKSSQVEQLMQAFTCLLCRFKDIHQIKAIKANLLAKIQPKMIAMDGLKGSKHQQKNANSRRFSF